MKSSRFVFVPLLALLMALGACGGEKSPGAGGAPTTPGSTVAPTVAPSGKSSTPAGAKKGGGTKTVEKSSPGAAPGAKPYVARPAGTYSYATTGQTKLSGAIRHTYTMPPVTTLAVDPASGNTQHSVRDLRDSDGNGRVTEMVAQSLTDGLHLTFLKNTSHFAGVTDERTFQPSPPPLILRAAAPNGDHLSFTMEGSGITVATEIDVLRRESISIGGTAIQAIVITIKTTFSGDVQGTDTATNWIRPSDGLLLREDDASSVSAGITTVDSNYSATLQSLTPA